MGGLFAPVFPIQPTYHIISSHRLPSDAKPISESRSQASPPWMDYSFRFSTTALVSTHVLINGPFYATQNLHRFYANLDIVPPRVSFIHPDDDDPPPNILNIFPPRDSSVVASTPHRRTASSPSIQGNTPFSGAVEAQRARQPSFAQQLYASAIPQNSLPTPANSDDELEEGPTFLNGYALQSSPRSISSAPNLYSSPDSSFFPSPSSSPNPSPSSMPLERSRYHNSHSISQRPRGARSPTFPRPFLSPNSGTSNLALLPVEEDGDEFPTWMLYNSPHSNPTPSSSMKDSQSDDPSRHGRASTLPAMSSHMYPQSTQCLVSKPKETPIYLLVARPPEVLPDPTKITTPAFQLPSAYQPNSSTTTSSAIPSPSSLPTTSPIDVLPASNMNQITSLPMVPDMPYIQAPGQLALQSVSAGNLASYNANQLVGLPPGAGMPLVQAQAQILPQQVMHSEPTHEVQEAADRKRARNKLLKKTGIAVGKSAGKLALRVDNEPGVMDAISAGISELAVSAATSAVSHAVDAATSSAVIPPQPPSTSTISPQQGLTMMQAVQMGRLQQQSIPVLQRPTVIPDYSSILGQMQAMQITQPQMQPISQQPTIMTPNYTTILGQMQAMQLTPQQQQQLMFSHQTSLEAAMHPVASQHLVQLAPTGTTVASHGVQSPGRPQLGGSHHQASNAGNWQHSLPIECSSEGKEQQPRIPPNQRPAGPRENASAPSSNVVRPSSDLDALLSRNSCTQAPNDVASSFGLNHPHCLRRCRPEFTILSGLPIPPSSGSSASVSPTSPSSSLTNLDVHNPRNFFDCTRLSGTRRGTYSGPQPSPVPRGVTSTLTHTAINQDEAVLGAQAFYHPSVQTSPSPIPPNSSSLELSDGQLRPTALSTPAPQKMKAVVMTSNELASSSSSTAALFPPSLLTAATVMSQFSTRSTASKPYTATTEDGLMVMPTHKANNLSRRTSPLPLDMSNLRDTTSIRPLPSTTSHQASRNISPLTNQAILQPKPIRPIGGVSLNLQVQVAGVKSRSPEQSESRQDLPAKKKKNPLLKNLGLGISKNAKGKAPIRTVYDQEKMDSSPDDLASRMDHSFVLIDTSDMGLV
ncbi:hypothetical protein BDZ97DRAFT_1912300 [Flammula alnicola]|nr:hypothetical protein BDZ97DRAFT_1912300 [Flammula alnicola]